MVDAEIDTVVVHFLRSFFHPDSVVSEESGGRPQGRVWWVDPHDGTKDFLNGHRSTSISVGLVDDDRVIKGFVHIPIPFQLPTYSWRERP